MVLLLCGMQLVRVTVSFLILGICLSGWAKSEPTQTKSCGPPPANWVDQKESLKFHNVPVFELRLSAQGNVYLNNSSAPIGNFGEFLREMDDLNPSPALSLKFEGNISCSKIYKIRASMNKTTLCQSNKCSENVEW